MAYSEFRDGYWLNEDGTWNEEHSGGQWTKGRYGWKYRDGAGWRARRTWVWIDGYCYYFNRFGNMVTNTTINGYTIDEDGHYVEE